MDKNLSDKKIKNQKEFMNLKSTASYMKSLSTNKPDKESRSEYQAACDEYEANNKEKMGPWGRERYKVYPTVCPNTGCWAVER